MREQPLCVAEESVYHRYEIYLDSKGEESLVVRVEGSRWQVCLKGAVPGETVRYTRYTQRVWKTCNSLPDAIAACREYLLRYFYHDSASSRYLQRSRPSFPDWALSEALLRWVEDE